MHLIHGIWRQKINKIHIAITSSYMLRKDCQLHHPRLEILKRGKPFAFEEKTGKIWRESISPSKFSTRSSYLQIKMDSGYIKWSGKKRIGKMRIPLEGKTIFHLTLALLLHPHPPLFLISLLLPSHSRLLSSLDISLRFGNAFIPFASISLTFPIRRKPIRALNKVQLVSAGEEGGRDGKGGWVRRGRGG